MLGNTRILIGLRQLALEFSGVCDNIQEIFESNKRDLALSRAALSSGSNHPTIPQIILPRKTLKRRNMDYTPFEDAIACNFSDDERVVVIELVSSIKDVACALLDSEFVAFTKEIFRQHVYFHVQQFALNFLTHPIRRAKKHKKDKAHTFLLQMRSMVAEWCGCEDSPNLPEVKGDKVPVVPGKIEDNHVALAPSSTQMYLLVFMLYLLINRHNHEKAVCSTKTESRPTMPKNFSASKLLCSSTLHIFNIQDSVKCVSNLTDLWLHEYWLDLCQTSKDSRVPAGASSSHKTDALAFFPLRLSLPARFCSP